jgi:mannose-6-phosphate isomerase-like protein (cupin superfamily)
MSTNRSYITKRLQKDYDYKAPDTSEIRLLPGMKGGGLAHCTLRPGHSSSPVVHKTVEEIWYFIEGEGLLARRVRGSVQWEVIEVEPKVSITIPMGVEFQFRNTGDVPLKFIIATMPPWPGKDEADSIADGYSQEDETEKEKDINMQAKTG